MEKTKPTEYRWHGPVKCEEWDSNGRLLYRISELAAKFILAGQGPSIAIGQDHGVLGIVFLNHSLKCGRERRKSSFGSLEGLRCSCDEQTVCIAVGKL